MDFVEQLKSSVDIVRTIESYGVKLKRMGSTGRYLGLCPFHTEKTPSFNVNSTMQRYKCFGCGVGGDVFNFVMELDRISFYEALRQLAETNAIPMPKRDFSDPDAKLRGALFEMHEVAASTFQANLKSQAGTEARNYLARRGVTPEQIEEFGLGVSDPAGQQLVRRFESRFSADVLEVSGLVMKRQDGSGFFDRFRGRLMFPIHNESGKVIGFGGRALKSGDEPKYLNSPETALYRKTYVLYNLHRAKDPIHKSDCSILVEGYMDVIGIYSAGVRNVVASCGTALTNMQVRALKRHSGRIVVNFDPDTAGANAAEKSIQMLLDESLHVRVLQLEGDLDPDEYVKEAGAAAYQSRLEKAPAYFHWLADRARKKFDMRTVDGRLEGFKFVAPSIQRISDRLERFAVANDVADYLGVDEKLVRDYFAKGSQEPAPTIRSAQVPPYERLLLNSLLISQAARDAAIPELSTMPAVDRFVTKNVFRALFELHAASTGFRLSDLEGRLPAPDQDLLSTVVFADEVLEEEKAATQARDCLLALKAQDPKNEKATLHAQVKAAERAGDFQEVMRLNALVVEYDQQRKRNRAADSDVVH